ncbi:nucleotidyl transferase AbiEii/AbiGii toxin family protein [Paractinoplanes maris]|uniref:nucleotidyl transferase AbiEii/AbiGii toxin family protein n=1 Tax=Paractinoplanes maris TaxID=1734446 RepID=UPI0020204228|nr:nucleotidyl transferase AbiEii/AbiGii toxin family protein [Actinoplanes maris]
MDPRHERLAEIALTAGGRFGFALAGGYAVSAHGMGNRLSGDVDLFTDWQRRGDFVLAVDEVVAALTDHGFDVSEVIRTDTFARLLLTDRSQAGSEPDKLELSADWRAHAPVQLEIGPVLHPDDAVANKMIALYGRAAARDFLDVDAAIASGRYTREHLLALASSADSGFVRERFAQALGVLSRITDADFALYGLPAGHLSEMRERFGQWREELLGG